MKAFRQIVLCALAACLAQFYTLPASAQESKGKILIVLSSEQQLPLKDGKHFQTGYYLNELVIPARKFSEAGYELVFANPKGNTPAVDQTSLSADYFGGSQQALEEAERYQATQTGLAHPVKLSDVAHGDLSQYKAVFVPGGPAPMIDLASDPDLGAILRDFHQHARTTVLLCHAPVALLSALNDAQSYRTALSADRTAEAKRLAAAWPYRGYRMTVFSDEEESIAATNVFHAEPLFTPEDGLRTAGGQMSTVSGWAPNVIQDRELITGQNPASDTALADLTLHVLADR
ncbi:type 1 glutamine amidotransferase domain-containing protein [Paraburkholderia sp. J12]|uniref:type 1 glutamine amidotransferase domain-containing protein n=1 Tax=Paraburkholderia sp. J12 TaxID=2805432 RepID=UPI002ABD7941|nr:type 1 glutamine amidotransferase domain-containing protein [Paraburkholderia sp. J12]